MKPRPISRPHGDTCDALQALAEAFACLGESAAVVAFLRDLCTPAELEALADRWRVVPLLLEGRPYREIHDHTGISVTTIGRVARCLEHGAGGYAAVLRARITPPAGSH
ncbi:DNA-binding transcriptional regulator [Xylella taiwanensis]|uniref:TrpR n=1 Tax=Xylella taiwanensis TaxID=1444770 RepID=Z9JK64_9GAMM|nr:YerC/YecD family TrpR-related protein [Xylella taiwanensis]AXI83743.1 TrpR [Xylella taiwanensis]EWS78226.1 TrpR [Xylella taiwanensis]MCD8456846.1 YerC/YecD family TrpR-related protein [Xylella taiwanensis]MCD8459255.1 YerC/YecD family TrpR-related protein [Xylella taiwanensis]MCD8461872.1 YerC/YecD family TrpR-related protein [Xylella taiwanensis]